MRVLPAGDGLQPIRDLDTVRNFLSGPGPVAILDLPWIPVYLIFVYLLHPLLGMLATLGAVLLLVLTLLTDYLSRGSSAEASGEAQRRHALSAEGQEERRGSAHHGVRRPDGRAVARGKPQPSACPAASERHGRRLRRPCQGVPHVPAVGNSGARSLSRHRGGRLRRRHHRQFDHVIARALADRPCHLSVEVLPRRPPERGPYRTRCCARRSLPQRRRRYPCRRRGSA